MLLEKKKPKNLLLQYKEGFTLHNNIIQRKLRNLAE